MTTNNQLDEKKKERYSDILKRMNEELNRGPLADLVKIVSLVSPRTKPNAGVYIDFKFELKHSHKLTNRLNAYSRYFNNVQIDYGQEMSKLLRE